MSTKNTLIVFLASLLLLDACSGDEVKPVDPDVYDSEAAKDAEVFQAARPGYTQEQFREIFIKVLNAKNDKAVENVSSMFRTMLKGIDQPGFSCRFSMESAQAYLAGARTEFSDVAGVDGDMLKEAWAQLRAELGQPEIDALNSWMTAEAQKLIEPQLEMGFSGPEANNFARFVQTCPDQFQSIIDELTNFLKSTNRWLELFSAGTFSAPTPA